MRNVVVGLLVMAFFGWTAIVWLDVTAYQSLFEDARSGVELRQRLPNLAESIGMSATDFDSSWADPQWRLPFIASAVSAMKHEHMLEWALVSGALLSLAVIAALMLPGSGHLSGHKGDYSPDNG